MKIILKKLLYFFSPFLAIWLFIFIVDPYNLFNASHIFDTGLKKQCTKRSHKVLSRATTLWKIIEFKQKPAQNILLGDSKVMFISDTALTKFLGKKTMNLSIGGASYDVINDLFWMAANSTKLDKVFIQVSFMTYNANISLVNVYQQVIKIVEKPYNYFLDWNILKDASAVFFFSITKKRNITDWEKRVQSDNWKRSKEWITNDLLNKDYIYPAKYYKEFQEIAEYCNKNHIKLVFIITPTFHEFKTYILRSGNMKNYETFKNDFKNLGETIDLDCGIPLSYNKYYFFDYFHIKPQYTDTLISLIFSSI